MKFQIKVAYGDELKSREVEGEDFAPWFIHRWYVDATPWRVSHISGGSICQAADGLTKADAKRIARALAEKLPNYPVVHADSVSEFQRKWASLDPGWAYLLEAVIAEQLGGKP